MILIYWAYLLYMCTPKSEIGHYCFIFLNIMNVSDYCLLFFYCYQ